MSVVHFATFYNRRQAEKNKSIQTTTKCATCMEYMWLTSDDITEEKFLICLGCKGILSIGKTDEDN